jgi:hypothetical protein
LQTEIKGLSDEFDRYYADWLGAKVRFVKLAKTLKPNVAAPSQRQITQADTSTQSVEENESAADENQAAEETVDTRAGEEIPVPEDSARATTNVAPEDQSRPAEEFAVPEETEHARQLHHLCLKKLNPLHLLLLPNPQG